MLFLWVIVGLAAFGLGYIRFAPADPAIWHVELRFEADRNSKSGASRIWKSGPNGLARLDQIARATPRTRVFAGSVEEGRITYVTRSAVFGFPDYSTAQQDGELLKIYARQRFGRSDLGVNRIRIQQWGNAITGDADQPG